MKRPILTTMIALAPVAVAAQVAQGPANAEYEPAFPEQTRAPALPETAVQAETFVDGLVRPWGIVPLPDGAILVTERPGRLRMIGADGALSDPIAGLPEIAAVDQGGLLDVTVADDFAQTRRVWFTYAKPMDGGYVTAAATALLSDDATTLTEVEDIFVQEPVSPVAMHFGSRIVIDGTYAWITTGEHFAFFQRDKAQDISTTFGKVIRVTRDGAVPEDNPMADEGGIDTIWSLGHRNIQGAALHPDTGALWTIEHGPAGGDELNVPEAGLNYGWPVVSYGLTYGGAPIGSGLPRAPEYEEPVYYWDPVIAPGGMAFYDGELFEDWQGNLLISSLAPGGLVRLTLESGLVTGEERLVPDAGRIRDVEVLDDGSVLLLVDAEDGAILRVTPAE